MYTPEQEKVCELYSLVLLISNYHCYCMSNCNCFFPFPFFLFASRGEKNTRERERIMHVKYYKCPINIVPASPTVISSFSFLLPGGTKKPSCMWTFFEFQKAIHPPGYTDSAHCYCISNCNYSFFFFFASSWTKKKSSLVFGHLLEFQKIIWIMLTCVVSPIV